MNSKIQSYNIQTQTGSRHLKLHFLLIMNTLNAKLQLISKCAQHNLFLTSQLQNLDRYLLQIK